MHSISLIRTGINIILPIFLITLFSAAGGPREEEDVLFRFEQGEAEQISFHFWVPIGSVENLYPDGITPAPPRRTSIFRAPPPGSVDCFLVFRLGSYTYQRAGEEVTEQRLLNGYLLLAAEAAGGDRVGSTEAALLAEYYCGSETLSAALLEAGVPVRPIKGEFTSTLRADSQQLLEGAVEAGDYDQWRFRAVTTDLRHYDTARLVLRAFFKAGEELRALEIQYTDDYYMRAWGDIVLGDSSPFDSWQGWMRADDNPALYYFTNRNPHLVRRFASR